MKILHYSDKNSNEFSSLYDQCDVLITTGDLTYFDINSIEQKAHKRPAFGVYGNHDSGKYLEELGITNLNKKIIEWNNLSIGGFQGCLQYKNSPIMFTEEEAREFADSFPPVDILLLHAGPKDLLDDPTDVIHTGSESIKRYVLEKSPKYVFLGHEHSNNELMVNNTKIYRTYGARIIEI